MPTFPAWPGELPPCLDPLNGRHYFLLLYWIYFRPTALKCYLYRADPELYRAKGEKEIWKVFAIRAYRQLMVVAVGSTIALGFISALLISLPAVFAAFSHAAVDSSSLHSLPEKTLAQYSEIAEAAGFVAGRVLNWVIIGVVFVVVFVVVFGVAAGVALGVAGVVAFGVAVVYGVALGVAGGVPGGVVYGVALGVTTGSPVGVAVGLGTALGGLRVPFYLVQGAGWLQLPWRSAHPIWWDELAVLPFLGTERASSRPWRHGEKTGLLSLVRLAANPFQRWVLQRALVRQLHSSGHPIQFVYRLLRLPELEAYAIAPLWASDWKEIPTVRQVFLAELAEQGEDTSRGLERQVHGLTQPFRLRSATPLTAFARLLHAISRLPEDHTAWPEANPLAKPQVAGLLQSLLAYPSGSELQSSFACLAHGLQVSSLRELTTTTPLLRDLPPAQDAIRPEVIEALQCLGLISQNIAVSLAASSRLNQLAALARASEALEELDPFIDRTVLTPEKVLLHRIRRHWRGLVAEESGRLGHKVERKRVVNPYVAGNPVKDGLFVGREEILGELEERWLKPGLVDSLVLYGHRRMGKSSILQNLPRRLDPAANWIVQFNLQTVNRSHTGSLLFDLAHKMRDQLQLQLSDQLSPAAFSALSVPEEAAFRDNYQRAFNQWLDQLAPLMAGRRFIIAMDEYERLEDAMAADRLGPEELSDYLRGVIQTRAWFVLALAGLYTLGEQCHDYWHPLFGSIKPRKVSFLSPAATRRLLTQPSDDFPLDYTNDTLAAIYELTHGQPYLVQLIGQNLVSHFNRQVLEGERDPDQPLSLPDLQAVIDSPDFFPDGSAYFNGVWKQAEDAPPGQHTVLLILSEGAKDLAQLAVQTGLSTPQLRAALQTLVAHDVVSFSTAQAYNITVELMRRWLAQRRAASNTTADAPVEGE